jgi:hypothetical protein
MDTAAETTSEGAVVVPVTRHPVEVVSPDLSWAGIFLAWTAELKQRTGSERTPTEYGRYAEHFRELLAGRGDGVRFSYGDHP